jgi:AraC-like DNA-binding protein
MLTAKSDVEFRSSRLRTWLALARRFRAHLVIRNKLLYDSRYSVPATPDPGWANLQLVLEGNLEVDGGASSAGPSIWVLLDSEHEAGDPAGLTFRSWGDPLISLDLRVPVTDIAVPVGLAHGPRAFDEPTRRRFEAFVRAFDEGPSDALVAPFRGFIESLHASGVLTGDLPRDLAIPEEEPEFVTRLWRVVAEVYMRQEVLPQLSSMSDSAGLSYRQLDRDLAEFCRSYKVPGDSLRSAARYMRLRAALLYLSAPGATVSDVAQRVGYGSAEAMARAFRDATLPSPRRIRQLAAYRE